MNPYWIGITAVLLFSAYAETEVGGVLKRDTRWNRDDGPYILTEDLVVSRNVRLTIASGCRIVVSSSPRNDTAVPQLDNVDSRLTSIKVYGTLICVGSSDKRITFSPDTHSITHPSWYGIILDDADDQFTEITYTDISGAFNGIMVKKSAPLIHHVIIEHNHTGLLCTDQGSVRIYNSLIGFNTSAGIRTEKSNPSIINSIIVFNRNNGIWCDGMSKINCSYNCIFGNADGDLLDCDPEIGLLTKTNKNGDSIDVFNNVLQDPVFSGSPADSSERLKDPDVPTEKALVRDTVIAAIIHEEDRKTAGTVPVKTRRLRYQLSRYSPCRDAGDPSSGFKDRDGSRNDMGIYGGPAVIGKK